MEEQPPRPVDTGSSPDIPGSPPPSVDEAMPADAEMPPPSTQDAPGVSTGGTIPLEKPNSASIPRGRSEFRLPSNVSLPTES